MNKYSQEKIEFSHNLNITGYIELSQNMLIEISSNGYSCIRASITKVLKILIASILLYYYVMKYQYELKYSKIDHNSNYLYLLPSSDYNMIQLSNNRDDFSDQKTKIKKIT